jgi:excisionase family DNA binding protein
MNNTVLFDEKSNTFFDNFIWLNSKEAAEYLRTTPKQIRKWVYQGRIQSYRLLGKSLRFKKSDLDLLFKGGRTWE